MVYHTCHSSSPFAHSIQSQWLEEGAFHFGRKSTTWNSNPSASNTCPGLRASVYMFRSSCGWKRPVWRQLSTDCIPGGSVSRKTPQLLSSQYISNFTFQVTEHLRRILGRRANNRNTLRHHDLVPTMRMQVSTTHETGLSGMCMNPTQHHQVLRSAVIEECTLVDGLACITRAFLLGNHET